MIEWSEQHLAMRDAFRRFIDAEIRPRIDELEHGDVPPYDVLRKMIATFGMAEMRRARCRAARARSMPAMRRAMQMIPMIELSPFARAW